MENGIFKILHWLLIALCVAIVTIFAVLIQLNSPYLGWNYNKSDWEQQAGGHHQPQGRTDREYSAADQGQEDKSRKSDHC